MLLREAPTIYVFIKACYDKIWTNLECEHSLTCSAVSSKYNKQPQNSACQRATQQQGNINININIQLHGLGCYWIIF